MAATALVVDDSATIRDLIAETLAQDGCAVLETDRGGNAVDQALMCRPDVILLDLDLPDMDGLAVLRALKSDPDLRDTPVVMLLPFVDPDTARQALERGAAQFLCKPFSETELLTRVDAAVAAAPASTRADHVAGLPNREHLLTMVQAQTAIALRTGRPFGLVLVDIDDLDALLGAHPGLTPEDLLRAVAQRFRPRIGVSDLMVRHDRATLALLLPNTPYAAAMARAEQLRAALASAAIDTPVATLRLSACFGVAAHASAEHGDKTLVRAEYALVDAMTAHGNAVEGDPPSGILRLG